MLSTCVADLPSLTVDGRAAPTLLLSSEADVTAALGALHAAIRDLRASGQGESLVALAVDMEFSLRPRNARQSCDTMQIACGDLIFVFDVLQKHNLLTAQNFAPNVPSLRGLLADPGIVKILHHGSEDALVLRSYGISIHPVFDTAIADALLGRGDISAARHLGLVHDDWLLEQLRAAYPGRASLMTNGVLPAKHSFRFVYGLFQARPMAAALLQYCWQGVAYMPMLYSVMRVGLLAVHPMALKLTLALSAARMGASLARGTLSKFILCVCANADGVVLDSVAADACSTTTTLDVINGG
jgi:hypothetical protein